MQLVKTLSAIALVGAAVHATYAADELTLSVGGLIQVRAQHADAKDTVGNDWSVQQGQDGPNDAVDFSVRRSRLSLKGKYGDDWSFNLTLRADQVDNTGGNNANRAVQVYYAKVERDWKVDDGWKTGIEFGLERPFFNDADYMSDQKTLFSVLRPASALLKSRGVGAGWRLYGTMLNAGIDIQNTTAAPAAANVNNGTGEAQGLFYSGRIEFAPGADWMIAKRMESFVGKEGHGLVIGLDIGKDAKNLSLNAGAFPNNERNTTGYGADVLFHWNAISAAADFRAQKQDNTNLVTGAANGADVKSQIFDIQAGYAFPLADGTVLEPAVFFAKINNDKDVTEVVNYGGADSETPNSGTEFGIGLNYYLSGHDRKIQLNYTNWKAESGEAKANIIRLQFQQAF